jgi:ribosomal protein S25
VADGFYQQNNNMLKFDDSSEKEQILILFNHYICRKENLQRTKASLPRGQFYLSRYEIMKRYNVTESKAKGIIKKFVEFGIITQIYKGKNQNDLSIYQYNSCLKNDQPDEQLNNQPENQAKCSKIIILDTTTRPATHQANNQPNDQYKKEYIKTKNKKEINNKGFDNLINAYTENEDLKNAIMDFIKMRKAVKKVMTDKAVALLLKKLDKLAFDDAAKIEILNQSIINSWQGIYPSREIVANSLNTKEADKYVSKTVFRI